MNTNYLQKIFRYEEDTGELFWKAEKEYLFHKNHGGVPSIQ